MRTFVKIATVVSVLFVLGVFVYGTRDTNPHPYEETIFNGKPAIWRLSEDGKEVTFYTRFYDLGKRKVPILESGAITLPSGEAAALQGI